MLTMDRTRALALLVAATLWALGSSAMAFTMGETMAATGVHNSLAQGSASGVAKTLGSVRGALDSAVATKNGQLGGAAGDPPRWGGGAAGGATTWARPGAGAGGWVMAAANGSWGAGGTGWSAGGSGAGTAWGSGAWK
jgi:hypothetical protein